MAAFVSVLEAKAKDAGTAKNDYKQVETRSHSMIRLPSCTTWFLVGLSPRPMAHKTIALTTELKEPYMLGQRKLAPLGPGKQRDGTWPLFAKVCQFVTSCVLLNKAARRRLAFPRVSKNLKVAPFQSPPGQMAAFVSVLEAKAKRCRNGIKRLQAGRNAQPLHDPLPSCTTWFLVGLSPRPMAHKTIALTTELKEPYMLGKASPLRPRQATGWRIATFCKGLSVCHLVRPFEQGCKTAFGLPRVSKNLKVAPFQSPPGQMAAFVSVLEAKAKRCRNGKKRS